MRFAAGLVFLTSAVIADNICPDSEWTEFQEDCYRLTTFKMPWTSAPVECQLLNQAATAASVHSQLDNARLDSLLGGQRAWIGLARDAAGEFVWQDGSPRDYLYWDDGQPGAGNCTVINRNKATGQWGTADCLDLHLATCHVRATTPTPTPATCPQNWTQYQDTCYVNTNEYVEGEEVASKCRALHPAATPVSVHDQHLDRFLTSLIEYFSPWLGLSRPSLIGAWAWADGSPLDFTNWRNGEPSQDGNCAVIYGGNVPGGWVTLPCNDNQLPYYCQLEL